MNSAQLMEHFDILVGLDNNPILDKYFYLTSPHLTASGAAVILENQGQAHISGKKNPYQSHLVRDANSANTRETL